MIVVGLLQRVFTVDTDYGDNNGPKGCEKQTQNYPKGTQTDYKETPNNHRDPKTTPRKTQMTKNRHAGLQRDVKNPQRDITFMGKLLSFY